MINIKIISYGNFPYGGASANFLRNLALGLNEHNCKVEVLLPKGNFYGDKIEKKLNRYNTIRGVKYRFLFFKSHPTLKIGKFLDNFFGPIFLFIFLIYKALLKDVEYIIKYNISFTSEFWLIAISKLFNIQLINIIPEYYEKPSSGLQSMYKWYNFYFGFHILLKYTDKTIVLTHYLKQKILSLHKKEDINIYVQPNFINPDDFKLPLEPFNNINKEEFVIGYSGTPTKKDGIIDLLESFKIVHNVNPKTRLLIIGDLTNGKSLIPKLKNYCTKLEINDFVTFTGLVPFSKIPILLKQCDLLVLTRPNIITSKAGFPTKLGEYFASKIPVLVTKVGDMEYYFSNNNVVCLAEPGNIKDISYKIISLINNPRQRTLLIDKGYKWLMENLHYIKTTKKIKQFIVV